MPCLRSPKDHGLARQKVPRQMIVCLLEHRFALVADELLAAERGEDLLDDVDFIEL